MPSTSRLHSIGTTNQNPSPCMLDDLITIRLPSQTFKSSIPFHSSSMYLSSLAFEAGLWKFWDSSLMGQTSSSRLGQRQTNGSLVYHASSSRSNGLSILHLLEILVTASHERAKLKKVNFSFLLKINGRKQCIEVAFVHLARLT